MTTPAAQENPVEPFRRVSPRLATARLVGMALVAVPVLLVLVVGAIALDVPTSLSVVVLALWVCLAAWYGFVAVRQVKALGYQCRADDLLIERGIMLRRSTLVPYGRMQFVEVSQGPIARRFGLASVELHTAAALSEASVDGLPRAEAESLRDHLAARGEGNLAGL